MKAAATMTDCRRVECMPVSVAGHESYCFPSCPRIFTSCLWFQLTGGWIHGAYYFTKHRHRIQPLTPVFAGSSPGNLRPVAAPNG